MRAALGPRFDVVEVATELLGIRLLQRLPDVTKGLAGHPRDVGEALPDGDRVGHLRDVVAEQVVEAEPPLVAQLHDHHRDEGLGVGADQELVVGPGHAVAVQVRDADPVTPGEPAPAAHRGIETRDPSLTLLAESDASQAPGRGVQEWAHGPNLASGAVLDSRRRCERGPCVPCWVESSGCA